MPHPNSILARLAIAPLIGLIVPAGALAAEVPASAYSGSVLVPIELLDDDNLVFLFPQLGTSLATQIQASTVGSSVTGVGATARFDRHAVFLLSSDQEPISDFTSRLRLAQTGFGGDWGFLRAGVAVRASRHRDVDGFERDAEQLDAQESIVNYGEAALGVGWGHDRAFFDVVAEAFREDFEHESINTSPGDTTAYDFQSSRRVLWRGAVRLSVPVGSGTDVRAWGSFRELSTSLDVTAHADGVRSAFRLDDYGHEWGVALALVHRPNDTDHLRLSASYENARPPTTYGRTGSFSSRFWTNREKSDFVGVGFSLERPIWWELRFLTGFRSSFTFLESIERFDRPDGQFEKRIDTREFLSQHFAWGVQRSIRMFDLTGSMRTDLQLLDLFVSVDARVRFR